MNFITKTNNLLREIKMYDGAIRPERAELAKPIHNATPYFYMKYNNLKYVFTLSNNNIVEYV
jgi:hypothetical protein